MKPRWNVPELLPLTALKVFTSTITYWLFIFTVPPMFTPINVSQKKIHPYNQQGASMERRHCVCSGV